MVKASLPIKLDIPSDGLAMYYSPTEGVNFGFKSTLTDDKLDVFALFDSACYWVEGGKSSSVLPAFSPTFDSIILKPLILSGDIKKNICHPFPAFITYENVDKKFVQYAMEANIIALWNVYSSDQSTIDEITQKFFNEEGKIWCDAGDLIARPSAWTIPDASFYPIGFTIRTWKDKNNELIYPHVYLHHLRFIEPSIPISNIVYDQLPYGISNAVGDNAGSIGGNKDNDLYVVRQRFLDLGFKYKPSPPYIGWKNNILTANTEVSSIQLDILVGVIKLFQSIYKGRRKVSNSSQTDCNRLGVVDGKIDKRERAEQWLWASNAPRWEKLISGNGYRNSDKANENKHNYEHDFGTQFLKAAIKEAGRKFIENYWNNLTDQQKQNYNQNPLIHTNDASWESGGDTDDEHETHETGLDVDIKVPKKDGTAGGITWSDSNYDRLCARAIAKAFSSLDSVERIYFNDDDIYQGSNHIDKVEFASGHDNHFHVVFCPDSDPIPWDNNLGGLP